MKRIAFVVTAFITAAAVMTITSCVATTQAATTTEETTSAEKEDRKQPEDQLLSLVNSNKLSQETYDAIQKYLKENQPERPSGEEAKNPPQGESGSKGGNPPEKPANESQSGDKEAPPEKPSGEVKEMPDGKGGFGMMINTDTLDSLLSNGVITQTEYDVIKEVVRERPEKQDKDTETE